MAQYTNEREGQLDFFETFLPRIDIHSEAKDYLANHNDGVVNGNLLEFKMSVSDLNAVLFQCIKYLSALRIKGVPVPANILIIDLTVETLWLYHSAPYLNSIEEVYIGGASRHNSGFKAGDYVQKIVYTKADGAEQTVQLLKENKFTKIHIDENCIVGWAKHFYNKVPNARKEDFIGDKTGRHQTVGEIRQPVHLAEYILPYKGKSNVKFDYLMDKLNDTIQKKNLGAFYTPEPYCRKAIELVRLAIDRVPAGNDYVIIDRCAGTGNLERWLTDDELSHCIVSTVEYYEYKVLLEILGSKVRHIIPPTELPNTFNAGLVNGADALSQEYIDNPIITCYLQNQQCTIILFENPPYAETTSIEHQRRGKGKQSSTWKNSYVVQEMKKEVRGTASNDLGNAFIWSAFKYYLRQPTDSYVVFSPVKYWKAQHLIDKEFIRGFAFNRRHFHTNIDACIMCALWGQSDDENVKLDLKGYDIETDNKLSAEINLKVLKIEYLYSKKYYERQTFNPFFDNGILIGLNGREASINVKKRIKPIYSDDMLGYLVADSIGFDNPDAKSSLLIAGRYNGNGFYLRKDNYLSKLPMFCASRYITYNSAWTERGRIMKSGDGADRFHADVANGNLNQYLLRCLLFTCMEMQNHMRTFTGSDGRFYRNELCLDDHNGPTIASRDITGLELNDDDKQLLEAWNSVIEEARKVKEYDSKMTYGVYQIYDELDTSYTDKASGKTIYNNVELHSALRLLKTRVREYYNKNIVPTLFAYEFLK